MPEGDDMPRTQVLPFAWDVKKEAWYHIYAHDPPAPGDPIHWTGWAQNWNHMCADCHSTNLHKEFDFSTIEIFKSGNRFYKAFWEKFSRSTKEFKFLRN